MASTPSMVTVPESAYSSPAMMRSRVDLPPPQGPSRAVSWPVGMVTLTSSSATKSPKLLVQARTSMLMGFVSFSGAQVCEPARLGRRMATTMMQETDDHRRGGGRPRRPRAGGSSGTLLDEQGGGAVWPMTCPSTILTAPNSPSERARVSTTPYTIAQLMPGRVIRQKRLQRVGPEAAGRLLLLDADLLEHRHDLADDQRQGHEAGGHDDARRREDDVDAAFVQRRRTSRSGRCRRAPARGRRRPARPTAGRSIRADRRLPGKS